MVMKLIPAIYRTVQGITPNGMCAGTVYPLSMVTVSLLQWGGVHVSIPGQWDLLIAHPPCTYLSGVTTRHLSLRMNSAEKIIERMWKLAEAAIFFMRFALARCDHIVIENPTGFMSRLFRKPDQIIHPYYFAKDEMDIQNYQKKRTALWLIGVKPLERTNNLKPPEPYGYTVSGKAKNFEEMGGKIPGIQCSNNRAIARSKTFPGVAEAMAVQWSEMLEKEKQ